MPYKNGNSKINKLPPAYQWIADDSPPNMGESTDLLLLGMPMFIDGHGHRRSTIQNPSIHLRTNTYWFNWFFSKKYSPQNQNHQRQTTIARDLQQQLQCLRGPQLPHELVDERLQLRHSLIQLFLPVATPVTGLGFTVDRFYGPVTSFWMFLATFSQGTTSAVDSWYLCWLLWLWNRSPDCQRQRWSPSRVHHQWPSPRLKVVHSCEGNVGPTEIRISRCVCVLFICYLFLIGLSWVIIDNYWLCRI